MQKMQNLVINGDGEMEDLLQQVVQAEDLAQLESLGSYEGAGLADFQLFEQIDALLVTLDEQAQAIVQLYFGLEGAQPLEIEEIARRIGLDPIQVEEQIHGALAQLRAPALVAV